MVLICYSKEDKEHLFFLITVVYLSHSNMKESGVLYLNVSSLCQYLQDGVSRNFSEKSFFASCYACIGVEQLVCLVRLN